MFLAYNFLLIGERKMDFMSYHLLKIRELAEYRQARKKADVLAVVNTFVLLLVCGIAIWLKFKFIGG